MRFSIEIEVVDARCRRQGDVRRTGQNRASEEHHAIVHRICIGACVTASILTSLRFFVEILYFSLSSFADIGLLASALSSVDALEAEASPGADIVGGVGAVKVVLSVSALK